MIALQSLKYKIFEWCIDTLANKLISNFRTNPNGLTRVPLKDLRRGMTIAEIWIIIDSRGYKGVWKNCKIVEVVYHESGKKWNLKEVWFTWASYWSNDVIKIEYPHNGSSYSVGSNLSSIQSVDWDIHGVNDLGITPEFYI